MKQQLLKVINAGHKLQNTTILNKRVERGASLLLTNFYFNYFRRNLIVS